MDCQVRIIIERESNVTSSWLECRRCRYCMPDARNIDYLTMYEYSLEEARVTNKEIIFLFA